jgi:hypothetical protein
LRLGPKFRLQSVVVVVVVVVVGGGGGGGGGAAAAVVVVISYLVINYIDGSINFLLICLSVYSHTVDSYYL